MDDDSNANVEIQQEEEFNPRENTRNWGPDPSPEEIRERCEEIRKGWSEEERINRIADFREKPDYVEHWEVPKISKKDLDLDLIAPKVLMNLEEIGFESMLDCMEEFRE